MMFIGLIKNSSPIFIKNHFSIKYRLQSLKKIYIISELYPVSCFLIWERAFILSHIKTRT